MADRTKMLPIHVLFQQGSVSPMVLETITDLVSVLNDKKFPFKIKIGFIGLGKITNDLLNIPFPKDIGTRQDLFRSDFGAALSQILVDYKNYSESISTWELLEPEIIVFMTGEPSPYKTSDRALWLEDWNKIFSQYRSKMFVRVVADISDKGIEAKYRGWFPNAPEGQPKISLIRGRNIFSDSEVRRDLIYQSIMSDKGGYLYFLLKKIEKGIKSVDLPGSMPKSPAGYLQQPNLSPASGGVMMSPSMPSPSIATNNQRPVTGQLSSPQNTPVTVSPQPDSMSAIQPINATTQAQPVVATQEQPPKPEFEPAQPAEWQINEPPKELEDRSSHIRDDNLNAGDWYICGASRRGKLHENEATFREDEFAIDYATGWILVAVADGAGSHHLSRVGSKLSVNTALDIMKRTVENEPPSKSVAKIALQDALREAWKALFQESERRKVEFRDLSTTLLLLMYHQKKNLVGVAQIGDGLIAAQLEDGRIALLGNPESGEYSGQTYFLTNHKPDDLPSKCEAPESPGPIKYFFVMTDGVADDLYPPQERLPGLIKAIPGVMASDYPHKALLELINYNRPGSFDDRTLVVVCKRQEIVKEMSAQEQPKPVEAVKEAPTQAPQQTPEAKPSEPQSAQQENTAKSEEEKLTVSLVSTDKSIDKINGKEQESSGIPDKSVDDNPQATQQDSNKTPPVSG